jgi:hypothetical protein
MATTATSETMHEAIVAALGELSEIVADETADTGTFRYKYAPLSTIMRTVRPVLAKHGVVIVQLVNSPSDGGMLLVSTQLVHRSGVSLDSGALALKMPQTPQQLGSLISYVRRYQLTSLLGVAIDDDDAQGAQAPQRPGGGARGTSPTTSAGDALTRPQATLILTLFGELGLTGPEHRDARLSLTSEIVGRALTSTNEVSRAEAPLLIDELRRRVDELREAYDIGEMGSE